MPRVYEREYSEDTSDYKRKRRTVDETESGAGNTISGGSGGDGQEPNNSSGHHHHDAVPLNEKTNEYLQECLLEQKSIEKKYSICKRLLDSGKNIGICKPKITLP